MRKAMWGREPALCTAGMLSWARRSANIDADAAAASLSITTERLDKWERGDEHPSVAKLREMAALYRRPLAAFYMEGPPRDFTLPRDLRRVHGANAQPFSPRLVYQCRLALSRRQVALDLSEGGPQGAQFVGSVPSARRPVEVAASARLLLGLTVTDQLRWNTEYVALNAWKDAVERLGVLVFHFTRVKVEEARGFSVPERTLPIIGLNGSDGPRPRMFTLAHELGHLLLGSGGMCGAVGPMAHADEATETFCNMFAGCLLAPADALLSDPSVRNMAAGAEPDDALLALIADRFKLTREVILRRLVSIGMVSREFYRLRRARYLEHKPATSEDDGFLPWEQRVVRDLGQPFIRTVLDAYYDERITSADVAEHLGTSLDHLPGIMGRLARAPSITGG